MPSQDRRADQAAEQAARLHRAGDLAGADRLYREALALRPDHADGLHGLGVLALGRGQSGQAIAFIGRAVAVRPEVAVYYLNLGLALRDQGHAEQARAALQVAVLRDPDDPRAHAALAAVLEALHRPVEAEAAAAAAVRCDPGHGTPATAIPGGSAALGRLRIAAGRLEEALAALHAAVREAPDDASSWHRLGEACGRLGRTDGAEAAFRRVVALLPDDPAASANLGGLLFERGRLDEAEALLRRAASCAAPTAETLSNLGLVLMATGHLPEAERALAQASALQPGSDGIAVNRGSILAELGRHAEAEGCLLAVEARAPSGSVDAARARFNRATVLLATGRHRDGWAAFEARRRLVPPAPSPLPDWDGRALPEGAAVLLHAEQGLGDAIQFLRFVRRAAERASVRLLLPEALQPLVSGLLSSRCRLATPGCVDEGCVAQASLLSLPFLLGCAAPVADGPYLSVPDDARPEAAWLDARPAGPTVRLTVGLNWAGSPGYRFDRRRSLQLHRLGHLSELTGIRFVSLQQGEAARQPAPDGLAVECPPGPPASLAGTAALIARLDLVVTVDTAIGHLAGALGRPVWLLNRYGGDWRWQDGNLLPDGRSAWYPTLRQFRQREPLPPDQAWQAPLRDLARALGAAAGGEGGVRCR